MKPMLAMRSQGRMEDFLCAGARSRHPRFMWATAVALNFLLDAPPHGHNPNSCDGSLQHVCTIPRPQEERPVPACVRSIALHPLKN